MQGKVLTVQQQYDMTFEQKLPEWVSYGKGERLRARQPSGSGRQVDYWSGGASDYILGIGRTTYKAVVDEGSRTATPQHHHPSHSFEKRFALSHPLFFKGQN